MIGLAFFNAILGGTSMNGPSKVIIALLAALVILLAANLVSFVIHPSSGPDPAWANIVSGKNHFTTHTPDGRTIFLWFYNYEPANEMNAKVYYLGQIDVGGKFAKGAAAGF
jgi:hypothetical protein